MRHQMTKECMSIQRVLMAWGFGIPEEAYVSDDDLNKDVWQVLSRKETYDW